MTFLKLDELTVYYGPVLGVGRVSLEVAEGEVVALLGANGAGKSTVLKAVSGLVRPHSGSISFDGRNLRSVRAHERVRLGLVQVPEGRRIFPALTVEQNLELAGYGFGDPRHKRLERAKQVLEHFPLLQPHVRRLAGMLSGGEQQLLAIGRAMMASPRLLMVDEPSMGLAPQMVEYVYELLEGIARQGTSVLLVEQNVILAFEISRHAYVLQQGHVVLSGQSSDLADDPRVVSAYLGGGPDDGERAPEVATA